MNASRNFLSPVFKLRRRRGELLAGFGLVAIPCLLVAFYAFHVGQERGQYGNVAMLQGGVCLYVYALVIAFAVLDRVVALVSAMVTGALCFIVSGAVCGAYLAGLSRAASAGEFIGELSRWIYSAENSNWIDAVEHDGKRSMKPSELPEFLYVWIGRPKIDLPQATIYDQSGFQRKSPSPRSFEFGSIGIAFRYEPQTARRKIQDGVYVFRAR